MAALGLLLSVIVLPDWLKVYAAILFSIAIIVCGIGFIFSKDPETTETASQKIRGSEITGSNVASAGRDVHQHIYQPRPGDAEKLLADFIYDGHSSTINFRFAIEPKTKRPRAEVHLELRFVNKGDDIAHNIGANVYGCWIHEEPPRASHIDHIEPTYGRVTPGEARKIILEFNRYANTTGTKGGQLTLHSHKDVLVMLIEIIFSKLPGSSAVCRNEPIWLTWTPQIPTALCDSKQSEVHIARVAIDKIRPPS